MGNQYVGAAKFAYSTTSSTGTVTVSLGTPLHELECTKDVRAFTAESLNYAQRNVVHIGGSQTRLSGTVRFHNDARELLDLIDAGIRGYTLTYFHGSTASGHPCRLLDAGPVVSDRDPIAHDLYETRLTIGTASTLGFFEVL